MGLTPSQFPERSKPARGKRNDSPLRDPKGPGEGKWKGLVFFLLVAFVFSTLLYFVGAGPSPAIEGKSLPQLVRLLDQKQVKSIAFVRDTSNGQTYLEGRYVKPSPDAPGGMVLVPFRTVVDLDFNRDLHDLLAAKGFPEVDIRVVHNFWGQALLSVLPFLLFILALYLLFRQQIRMAGKTAFSFGKSRVRLLSGEKTKVTFRDVAGIEEAKQEVQEIVEFLRDPKRFQKLGGRIPKGVLMVGPPGTGKTLLAKAIAGEADVPFFSISGSDFVEMFVGVGASRVRDMFEQARRQAPCIVFIDEIDAVGRSRGTGLGGGHDEREQTLNALLVEMDGIESQEGVIVIAATNRKDVLDTALLRPGRFDREVRVNLPDIRGREEVLKVHSSKVKLSQDADLHALARGTAGFSGAELANLINEAALLAASRGKESIGQPELEEARDKVRWGRERKSLAMSDEEKKITAYHEAGHALLNVLLEHTDPLHKVSIIPRGPALGVTMMLPATDRYNTRKKELLDNLCVAMGGRVAEEVFLGDISSGASGDIRQATWYARRMVCEWGMSEKLGMVHYADDPTMTFLGRDLGMSRAYSEATAEAIDGEVKRLIQDAYQRAKELILANRAQMEALAKALLDYETLDAAQAEEIVRTGRLLSPPPRPNPDGSTAPSVCGTKVSAPAAGTPAAGGLLPGLEGSPA
ncbi:ATP-dependent zinc metalloprotease FtsH 2 [Methylacidimicrobium sp. AP8]|uniref:ATP-dependent zinc metalloprotease FtsH n=1 Tax=Methylacidimicrobium sp. AP8 TaxID=2730359 RepID=UPI0018C07BF7|nr:ATP-dependent zinc metalloprotease FtsH [Methylacidimicrobium sp. AP8]CAB4244343.1 ATP-dependent zinc metalloprotease FtsH 2 [Methylacidimicrobium sp. AP8]